MPRKPGFVSSIIMISIVPLFIAMIIIIDGCDHGEGSELTKLNTPAFDRSLSALGREFEDLKGLGLTVPAGKDSREAVRSHLATALEESRGVDEQQLREVAPSLPWRYRTTFVRGLRSMLAGIDNRDARAFEQGCTLIQEWCSWYEDTCLVAYNANRKREETRLQFATDLLRLRFVDEPSQPRHDNNIDQHGVRDMNLALKQFIQDIEIGEPQSHKNLTVFPLFSSRESALYALTLDEAIDKGSLEVTEVSDAGSVPTLKVANRSNQPVLLLDGEELAGAKQNRILNTTILVAAGVETTIPVSCSERGRWNSLGMFFSSSGNTMSYTGRSLKSLQVAKSLRLSNDYRSDQGKLWAHIGTQASCANVSSKTSAMSDTHASLRHKLRPFVESCSRLTLQQGLMVAIDGEVVGMDILTSDSAFGKYHSKLIRSYAIDAILSKDGNDAEVPVAKAEAFLQQVSLCKETEHESVGLGTDYRYDGPTLTGFALIHDKDVVHAYFLRLAEEADSSTPTERERVHPDRKHDGD